MNLYKSHLITTIQICLCSGGCLEWMGWVSSTQVFIYLAGRSDPSDRYDTPTIAHRAGRAMLSTLSPIVNGIKFCGDKEVLIQSCYGFVRPDEWISHGKTLFRLFARWCSWAFLWRKRRKERGSFTTTTITNRRQTSELSFVHQEGSQKRERYHYKLPVYHILRT